MCEIDSGDYNEMAQVWAYRYHKARKQYRCNCCWAQINPGDKYLYHFSAYDGRPDTGRLCMACDAISEKFSDEHGFSLAPSYVRQSIRDCIDYGDEDSEHWHEALAEIDKRLEQNS
jgi:hypothetical protein